MAQRTQHASTEPTINSPSKVTYDTAGVVLCPPSGVAPTYSFRIIRTYATDSHATRPPHSPHANSISHSPLRIMRKGTVALRDSEQYNTLIITIITMYILYYVLYISREYAIIILL